MEIIKFNKKYIREISKLMLKNLENPPKEFSNEIIEKFRKHAKEEGITKEFKNPALIGFLAINREGVVGFIVGYFKNQDNSIIDYVTGSNEVKKDLLEKFIRYCRSKDVKWIKTESFEFMDNHNFFEENGFKIIGKEKMENGLIMFLREIVLRE